MKHHFNVHRSWFKTVTIVVVCLFFVNDIASAIGSRQSRQNSPTLSPASLFNPIGVPGICKNFPLKVADNGSANVEGYPGRTDVTADFQECTTFLCLSEVIGRVLARGYYDKFSEKGLKELIESYLLPMGVEFKNVNWKDIKKKDGAYYLPYRTKQGKVRGFYFTQTDSKVLDIFVRKLSDVDKDNFWGERTEGTIERSGAYPEKYGNPEPVEGIAFNPEYFRRDIDQRSTAALEELRDKLNAFDFIKGDIPEIRWKEDISARGVLNFYKYVNALTEIENERKSMYFHLLLSAIFVSTLKIPGQEFLKILAEAPGMNGTEKDWKNFAAKFKHKLSVIDLDRDLKSEVFALLDDMVKSTQHFKIKMDLCETLWTVREHLRDINTFGSNEAKIDRRPVESGLLHRSYVEHDMAVKNVINPTDRTLTGVYGASGGDVSNFLLSTNAAEGYFISRNTDPAETLSDVDLQECFGKGKDPNAYIKKHIKKDVYWMKFRSGFTTGKALSDKRSMTAAIAFELRAVGVDIRNVDVDVYRRCPRIRFKWGYMGQKEQVRTITFIAADIAEPEQYEEVFKDKQIDVYYQRAAMTVADTYGKPKNSFLYFFQAHMRPGGFFVTDDQGYDPAEGCAYDRSEYFPLGWEITILPGKETLERNILQTRNLFDCCRQFKHYGWDVTIRQKEIDPLTVETDVKTAHIGTPGTYAALFGADMSGRLPGEYTRDPGMIRIANMKYTKKPDEEDNFDYLKKIKTITRKLKKTRWLKMDKLLPMKDVNIVLVDKKEEDVHRLMEVKTEGGISDYVQSSCRITTTDNKIIKEIFLTKKLFEDLPVKELVEDVFIPHLKQLESMKSFKRKGYDDEEDGHHLREVRRELIEKLRYKIYFNNRSLRYFENFYKNKISKIWAIRSYVEVIDFIMDQKGLTAAEKRYYSKIALRSIQLEAVAQMIKPIFNTLFAVAIVSGNAWSPMFWIGAFFSSGFGPTGRLIIILMYSRKAKKNKEAVPLRIAGTIGFFGLAGTGLTGVPVQILCKGGTKNILPWFRFMYSMMLGKRAKITKRLLEIIDLSELTETEKRALIKYRFYLSNEIREFQKKGKVKLISTCYSQKKLSEKAEEHYRDAKDHHKGILVLDSPAKLDQLKNILMDKHRNDLDTLRFFFTVDIARFIKHEGRVTRFIPLFPELINGNKEDPGNYNALMTAESEKSSLFAVAVQRALLPAMGAILVSLTIGVIAWLREPLAYLIPIGFGRLAAGIPGWSGGIMALMPVVLGGVNPVSKSVDIIRYGKTGQPTVRQLLMRGIEKAILENNGIKEKVLKIDLNATNSDRRIKKEILADVQKYLESLAPEISAVAQPELEQFLRTIKEKENVLIELIEKFAEIAQARTKRVTEIISPSRDTFTRSRETPNSATYKKPPWQLPISPKKEETAEEVAYKSLLAEGYKIILSDNDVDPVTRRSRVVARIFTPEDSENKEARVYLNVIDEWKTIMIDMFYPEFPVFERSGRGRALLHYMLSRPKYKGYRIIAEDANIKMREAFMKMKKLGYNPRVYERGQYLVDDDPGQKMLNDLNMLEQAGVFKSKPKMPEKLKGSLGMANLYGEVPQVSSFGDWDGYEVSPVKSEKEGFIQDEEKAPAAKIKEQPGITDPVQDLLDEIITRDLTVSPGEKIVIGIDTSWMPDVQKQTAALTRLLRKLSRIYKIGAENIIIRRREGTQLAGAITEEISSAADDEKSIPMSNILIIGNETVLKDQVFDAFRQDASPGERAFFAGVQKTGNFGDDSNIFLVEMITIAMKLAFKAETTEMNELLEVLQKKYRSISITFEDLRTFTFSLDAVPIDMKQYKIQADKIDKAA